LILAHRAISHEELAPPDEVALIIYGATEEFPGEEQE